MNSLNSRKIKGETIFIWGKKPIYPIIKKTRLETLNEYSHICFKNLDGKMQIAELIKVDNEPYIVNSVWVSGGDIDSIMHKAEKIDLEDAPCFEENEI